MAKGNTVNEVNYLDIQLRDMDYNNKYGNSLEDKFLDPQRYYVPEGGLNPYLEGYEKAKNIASVTTGTRDLKKEKSFKEGDFIIKIISSSFNTRRKKEMSFIDAWLNEHKDTKNLTKIKVPELKDAAENKSVMKNYQKAFSNFIKQATMEDTDPIVKALRSEKVAITIAGGLASQLRSSDTVKRFVKIQAIKKNNINYDKAMHEFYEDLFDLFFFNVRKDKAIRTLKGLSPDKMLDMINKTGGSTGSGATIFKQKFMDFVSKYYSEVSDFVDQQVLDSLGDAAFQNIFKSMIDKNNSHVFTYSRDFNQNDVRGISYAGQQQLKKMFEQTFREILQVSGARYEDFNQATGGRLRIYDNYETRSGAFHQEVQILINEDREIRNIIKKLKGLSEEEVAEYLDKEIQAGNISPETAADIISNRLDFRKYNVNYRKSNEIMDKFLQLLEKAINKEIAPKKITPKQKRQLDSATRGRIVKTLKRGESLTRTLSAYGYEQIRGLLGEIAAAYAMQKSGIRTEITGSDVNKRGLQKNYDVVAYIGKQYFGFQIKNVKEGGAGKTSKQKYTLYATKVSLAERAIYNYLSPTQVRSFRWIFANGIYLEKAESVDARKIITQALFYNIDSFLRITDPETKKVEKGVEGIESDVYVIGDEYYPASYIIYQVYLQVRQQIENKKPQDFFKIEGDYPSYLKKMDPTKDSKGNELRDENNQPTTRYRSAKIIQRKKGPVYQDIDKNLVKITDGSYVLRNKRIRFSGIRIQL